MLPHNRSVVISKNILEVKRFTVCPFRESHRLIVYAITIGISQRNLVSAFKVLLKFVSRPERFADRIKVCNMMIAEAEQEIPGPVVEYCLNCSVGRVRCGPIWFELIVLEDISLSEMSTQP